MAGTAGFQPARVCRLEAGSPAQPLQRKPPDLALGHRPVVEQTGMGALPPYQVAPYLLTALNREGRPPAQAVCRHMRASLPPLRKG